MSDAKQILIVDDELYLRNFLVELLEPEYQVHAAASAADALSLSATKFDLILIDVLMPGMSGIELCRALREHKLTTPILMLTALDEPATRRECTEAGANDLLCKPFHPNDLRTLVKRLIYA